MLLSPLIVTIGMALIVKLKTLVATWQGAPSGLFDVKTIWIVLPMSLIEGL
jgi:hypothetical protein